jgi:hypothetical protein
MAFLIIENMSKLMKTPDISTTNKLGSQLEFSSKNPYIFYLFDMPANIKPIPKIDPIKKYTIVFINLPKVLCWENTKQTKGISEVPIK